jgi:hypothetical protein
MTGPRFDELDGEVEDAPGLVESLARGAKQGVTRGFGDEISGMAGAVGHVWGRTARRAMDGNLIPDSLDELGQELEGIRTAYRGARDDIRAEDDAAEQANPNAFMAGEFAGNVATSLPTGGGALAAAGMGAAEGAFSGLGRSRADLTTGDVYDYVNAFEDTALGAGFGAAGGAAGHYVGRGLQKLGQKARGALNNARGQLWEEEAQKGIQEFTEGEERVIAQRAAAREATATADEQLAKQQGQAMEMDKGFNKRAAREADRFASARTQADRPLQAQMRASERPASAPPGLAEEPGTRTLGGYRGNAGERRAVNYDRVEAYREQLADPSLPPQQRQRLEQYVSEYGGAVDNPGAFERAHMEKELRKRYSRETVDRIMAGRVGPNGEILPRRAPQAPEGLPEPEVLTEPGAPRFREDATPPPASEASRVVADARERYPEAFEGAGPSDATVSRLVRDAREVNRGAAIGAEPATLVDPDMAAVRPRETFAPLPQRKPGAMPMALDRGGKPGPLSMEPTPLSSEAEQLVREAEEAMARRRAGAAGAQVDVGSAAPEPTIRTPGGEDTIPDARPPTLAQRPTRPSPPAASPGGFERLRSPAMERAMEREQGAGASAIAAAYGGMKEGGVVGATLGAVVGSPAPGAIIGSVLGGIRGLRAAAVKDPAVRARVISALRLAHLERTNPQVFARVGRGLMQALASKDPGAISVFEHVHLQSDPEFRVAHQQAEAATRDMSDEELLAELEAAGVL